MTAATSLPRVPRSRRPSVPARLSGRAPASDHGSGPSVARQPEVDDRGVSTDGSSSSLRLPIEELSRYAGLTALVSAVLAAAGILATIAYLAAWEVPAPILRLDPLTAALRSEVVLYQLAITGVVLIGLVEVSRRLERRRWLGRVALGMAVILIGFLAFDALRGGYLGPVITLAAGVALFTAHRWRWLSDRAIVVIIVLVSLASAAQTGYEMGVGYRDGRTAQIQLALTTTAPIGGLAGSPVDGAAWRYDGLYLVFRDGESIFVSRSGEGSTIWVVPATRIAAVQLVGSDR